MVGHIFTNETIESASKNIESQHEKSFKTFEQELPPTRNPSEEPVVDSPSPSPSLIRNPDDIPNYTPQPRDAHHVKSTSSSEGCSKQEFITPKDNVSARRPTAPRKQVSNLKNQDSPTLKFNRDFAQEKIFTALESMEPPLQPILSGQEAILSIGQGGQEKILVDQDFINLVEGINRRSSNNKDENSSPARGDIRKTDVEDDSDSDDRPGDDSQLASMMGKMSLDDSNSHAYHMDKCGQVFDGPARQKWDYVLRMIEFWWDDTEW